MGEDNKFEVRTIVPLLGGEHCAKFASYDKLDDATAQFIQQVISLHDAGLVTLTEAQGHIARIIGRFEV
jgi:hypothetical protein